MTITRSTVLLVCLERLYLKLGDDTSEIQRR
jgi:hypothetical protein